MLFTRKLTPANMSCKNVAYSAEFKKKSAAARISCFNFKVGLSDGDVVPAFCVGWIVG